MIARHAARARAPSARRAVRAHARDKSKRKNARAAAQKRSIAERERARRERSSASAEDDDEDDARGGGEGVGSRGASNAYAFKALELAGSYTKVTGRKLLEGHFMVHEAAVVLYNAPFACASHDAEDVFDYGNKAALGLFELAFDDFVGMKSTKSADEADAATQAERRALLDEAAEKGVIENYSGVRVSSTGRKFRIEDATVWTLAAADGEKIGQAVRFDRVVRLNDDGSDGDTIIVNDQGEWVTEGEDDEAAAAEDVDVDKTKAWISSLEESIKAQGDAIRALKAEGKTNDDADVQAAVEILLSLKSELEIEQAKIAN